MESFGPVEAVRFSLEQKLDMSDDLPEEKLRVKFPRNGWLVAIIRESYQLSKFSESVALKAVNMYYSQIQAEAESDGRMIDPAKPVQLSRGILEAVELITEAESVLSEVEGKIEQYDCKAMFSGGVYEETAKAGLNFSRTIIPRTRLFVHTYLWILWTHEALRQANQFGGLLQSDYNFERFSDKAFPYIAHPPLIVATVACTTMIEEAGVEYINAYTGGQDYDRDNDHTSAKMVLEDLESHFPDIEEINTTAIKEQVIEARDNISHYVIERKDVVPVDDFEGFYSAVIEGMELVDMLLAELINQPISEFQNKLENFRCCEWS